MTHVRIRGRGIAALTAACMLAGRGHQLIITGPPTNNCLQLALNADTVALIDDLHGLQLAAHPEARWIERRIVRGWHDGPVSVDAPVLSLPASLVAECLEHSLRSSYADRLEWRRDESDCEPDRFTIDAAGPGHPLHTVQSTGLTFGNRVATSAAFRVKGPNDVAILERTPLGWLFLLPSRGDHATLFVVVAQPSHDPEQTVDSAIVSSPISAIVGARQAAQPWRLIAPTLQHPLATRRFIRIGEAAFTFDPLCGDGVGYAVRSALLAATVVDDLAYGEPRGLEYYHARLTRTFRAHLQACTTCYEGWQPVGWSGELARARRGISFLQR